MRYIGLDPGVGGGIAVLNSFGGLLKAVRMPQTDQDILACLSDGEGASEPARAALEFVRSSPQMGVVSAFTFGRGYGGLRMALVAQYIQFDEVRPQVWQKALGCLTKGDKHVTKARAQELFPHVKVTNYIADALLLAEYCRRQWEMAR